MAKTKTIDLYPIHILPSINQFIHSQHHNIQIIHEHFFLNTLSQNLTDCVVKCIQDTDQNKLKTYTKTQ
jgi:hypothetical protein